MKKALNKIFNLQFLKIYQKIQILKDQIKNKIQIQLKNKIQIEIKIKFIKQNNYLKWFQDKIQWLNQILYKY